MYITGTNVGFIRLGVIATVIGLVVSSKNSINLTHFLLDNYPEYPIRPVMNESTPIVVYHRMTPIQLIDMVSLICFALWHNQTWTDEYLTWDPDDFGGIKEIQIHISKIWQPDVVLFSSTGELFNRHFDTDAIVSYDGKVVSLQFSVVQSTCSIDATFFPFDEQNCQMKFASWSYHGGYIDIIPSNKSNIDRFISNGEWTIEKMEVKRNVAHYVCCDEPFPDVTYTLHFKRRSNFYVINIILPSFLASIMMCVGFYLPSDSGERITLCVTSILSQIVFLTIVSAYMPPTADIIPHIQMYLFCLISMGVASAFLISSSLNMHFRNPGCRKVPVGLKIFAFNFLSRIGCTRPRVSPKQGERQSSAYSNHVEVADNGNINNHKMVYEPTVESMSLPSTQNTNANKNDREEQHRRVCEWREVARILDRAYLSIYLFALIVMTAVFIFYLPVMAMDSHSKEDTY
ncbi:neuronal acetylcholine receptor subunit alpha-9-like [Saccoglossus kowalevskii]